MSTEERKAFKDWFDSDAARTLGTQIRVVYPKLSRTFEKDATVDIASKEFAARVTQFSDALRQHLPAKVTTALNILKESLPDPLPDAEAVTDGWRQWPIGHFIGAYGLEDVPTSWDAMKALTQRFSAEFAVRPFIEHDPDDSFRRLYALLEHPSLHVRRWCSEGPRPRLPWGRKLRSLIEDPTPLWPIIDALKDDPETYVTRSVANNLNDIAKDHADKVVARCAKWPETEQLERVRRHALRTLIKDGHPKALRAIGIHPPKNLTVALKATPKKIVVGDSIALTTTIVSAHRNAQDIVVDYAVDYVRKKGTSSKVFKWKTLRLAKGETTKLTKMHAFKETSIRALYPGKHKISVQVNGEVLANATVTLG